MILNLKKNYELIIVFICLFLFLLILRDVYINEITFYDNSIKKMIVDKLRSDNLTYIMKIITFFGSAVPFIMIVAFLFMILKEKKYAYLAGINLLLITLLNNIIKIVIRRPRPLNINIIVEKGFSFPSGHSMVSAAFYGFLIYIIHDNIKEKYLRYILYTSILILILLIGFSRIYLGVHYTSDVLAGFLISISYLIIYISILPKYIKRRRKIK